MFPLVDYSDRTTWKEGLLGNYRFFGNLEAIQGENRIWLNNGTISIAVDLQDVSLYLVPSQTPYQGDYHDYSRGTSGDSANSPEDFEKALSYQEPVSVKWKQIFSLPEGTNVFVAGSLTMEKGRIIFQSHSGRPLLVVIFDGVKQELLKRSIWYGRQKNEYWNQFTLTSLVTGFFLLLFCTYIFLKISSTRIPALISLSLSLLPITLLLPPGVPLLFLYRILWKKARSLRAERDLLLLPFRYFNGNSNDFSRETKIITKLPDQSNYIMVRNGSSSSASFLPIKGNVKIRTSSLISSRGSQEKISYLFGAYKCNETGEYITQPDDPMAELIQIPGNPKKLAKKCHNRAQLFAFFSGFCILSEVLLNLFLLLFILQYYIQ
ncbi:MAG: hypothetical protein JXJ04_15410 [Spirochaetales bacterium]|nr:hypothetical protein [Spirochaetales bacterium]